MCEKVKSKRRTTYVEVADELVSQICDPAHEDYSEAVRHTPAPVPSCEGVSFLRASQPSRMRLALTALAGGRGASSAYSERKKIMGI